MSNDAGPAAKAIADKQIEKILLVLFLATAIVFSVIPIVNQIRKIRHGEDGSKDYPLWYDTGHRELHNVSPYYQDQHHEFPFMYPPGAAALLAPLSIAGEIPLSIFLVLLNTIAWATCILAPIYLVSGKMRGLPHVIYWVPSLVCCVFIWDTYLEGQLAFCLSACLLGMLVCLQLKKQKSAALLLALAAGFKAFPILALPYLIYRRHWKAVVYTIVFLFAMVVVMPAFFRGPHGALDDLKTWTHGMLSPNTPERMGDSARAARSYTWQNGSLLAVAHRWLRPVIADDDTGLKPIMVNFAYVPFKTIGHIAMGLELLICIGYLAVMPRGNFRTRFTDAVEQAMLLILIILICPMSFNYNNAWLMCGIAVVLYYIAMVSDSPAKTRIAIIWLLIALFPLIFSVSTKDPNWRYLRALGNTFFADMLLLIELAWLIRLQSAKEDAPVFFSGVPEGPS
jgi:Glycosyltransferase family 87